MAADDEPRPLQTNDVVRHIGLTMVTEDGVTLVADAWRPAAGDGPWPVLLQRLPYGRAVASTPVLPHPAWLARRGFAVVVQDCRGRGESGGRFTPFVDEGRDGAAAIEWSARLAFSDGRVATYGFSYQGLAQLYAAAHRPPSLCGVAAMMCCPDPYDGWTYEGGCLRLSFTAFWAAQLAGLERGRSPIPYDVASLPISAALGDDPPLWFTEWLAHPTDDAYWASRRPDLPSIAVPVLTVLGYFDDFSSGTAQLIESLGAEAVCGPWVHMPWGARHRGVELGAEAGPALVFKRMVHFFDRVFARDPSPPADQSARVAYLCVGGGWRTSSTWPPPHRVEQWTATSGGNANSRHGDGRLVRGNSDAGPADVLVVEPLVPYPGDPAAFQDEAEAEDRRDVVCYTSDVLTHALDLAGSPVASIVASCDRPTHDLVATLVLVSADGSARALTSGARRCLTAPSEREIRMRPIAWRCPAGSKLRLDISGARFPAFDRNPHAAIEVASARAEDTVVATVLVHRVRLDLPIDADPG